MLPTIHPDGTSAADLQDHAATCMTAAAVLDQAISAAWPNARDYSPQGPSAHSAAVDEWKAAQLCVRQIQALAAAHMLHAYAATKTPHR